MAIQITGSWDLTGSFTSSLGFQGTASFATTASYALTGGSGGGSTDTGSLLTTASVSSNIITFTKGNGTTFPITVATGSGGGNTSALVGNTDALMFPYLGPVTNTLQLTTGSLFNYYATSSGVHVLRDNNTAGSASVNIYFNTSVLSDGQYVYVVPYLLAGSGVGISYRTIISNPGNLPFYTHNAVSTGLGTLTSNSSRTSGTDNNKYISTSATSNPVVMSRISGSIMFSAQPYQNYTNIFGPYTGASYGTPIT